MTGEQLTGTQSLLYCLFKLKQRKIAVRLPKSFYSRSILFKRTNNFGSVFPNRLDRRIYKTKFQTHTHAFLFSTLYLPYHLTPHQLFVRDSSHVMLYQFPVQSSRKVEGNFTHKVHYHYYCHFPSNAFR